MQPYSDGIQRSMLVAAGSESIGEPKKICFVGRVLPSTPQTAWTKYCRRIGGLKMRSLTKPYEFAAVLTEGTP
jgi:hypothetical protein